MMLFSIITVFPFMVCLFWTAVYLLDWRSYCPARRLLTVFMSASTALYFCHAVFFHREQAIIPATDTLYAFCHLAVFPLFYLYVRRLTVGPFPPRLWLVLTPAVAVGIWVAVVNILGAQHHIHLAVSRAMFLLQILPVCYLSFKHLKAFDRKIEDFYADTESRSVAPIRILMTMLVACTFLSAIASHVGREYFLLHTSLLAFPSLSFGCLLFGIGYVGMKQTFSADSLACEEEEEPRQQLKEMPKEKAVPIIERLNRLMESEHLYLQPDLRLSDVAAILGVGRTTLSSSINQSIQLSFSDYVNTHRIRHAKELMSRQPSMPLQQVAEQCGFTIESSFYRAFRKLAGMTPKQWKSRGDG